MSSVKRLESEEEKISSCVGSGGEGMDTREDSISLSSKESRDSKLREYVCECGQAMPEWCFFCGACLGLTN